MIETNKQTHTPNRPTPTTNENPTYLEDKVRLPELRLQVAHVQPGLAPADESSMWAECGGVFEMNVFETRGLRVEVYIHVSIHKPLSFPLKHPHPLTGT